MKNKSGKICSIVIIVIFSLYYIWYCNSTMIELPFLTWFRQIPLAELFFSGNLEVKDLFSKFGEHGMLANNIIYLINVRFFHGSTLIDVYINDFNVIVTGCIFAYCTAKTIENNITKCLCILTEAIFLFGCMQGSSGAMETQVRLGVLFFVVVMIFVDKELREEKVCIAHLMITIGIIFLSINVFGTLYSFAGVPLVWFIVCFGILKNKKNLKKNIAIAVTYITTIPLYIAEYQLIISKNEEDTISLLVKVKNLILGFFSWCANGCLGYAVYEISNSKIWLWLGFTISLIIIISIVLFFYCKMYQKTWIPLMGIMYSFGVYVMVFIGRSEAWGWFANEWYTVHIKMMAASSIWIYIYAFSLHKCKRWITIGGVMVLCLAGITGNAYTLKRAPFVKAWYEEKQKYLFVQDADDMPVDSAGDTPLLASMEETMDSISILKKYNLSVYRYYNMYEKAQFKGTYEYFYKLSDAASQIGNTLDSCVKEYGYYADGWVEKKSQVLIKTGEEGKVDIEVYYPQDNFDDKQVKIYINDNLNSTVEIQQNNQTISVDVAPNQIVCLRLETNFLIDNTGVDTRELAMIISSMQGR